MHISQHPINHLHQVVSINIPQFWRHKVFQVLDLGSCILRFFASSDIHYARERLRLVFLVFLGANTVHEAWSSASLLNDQLSRTGVVLAWTHNFEILCVLSWVLSLWRCVICFFKARVVWFYLFLLLAFQGIPSETSSMPQLGLMMRKFREFLLMCFGLPVSSWSHLVSAIVDHFYEFLIE